MWAKFAYTAADGKVYDVDYYNLDVIISVGYRVKSKRGTQFRIWATGILKEYMRKGFALNDERLKNLGGGGYFKELQKDATVCGMNEDGDMKKEAGHKKRDSCGRAAGVSCLRWSARSHYFRRRLESGTGKAKGQFFQAGKGIKKKNIWHSFNLHKLTRKKERSRMQSDRGWNRKKYAQKAVSVSGDLSTVL